MEIKDLRKEIDEIDDSLSALYLRRIEACRKIGELKAAAGLPILAAERENAILARITKGVDDELKLYLKQLYDNIFLQSKNYQNAKGQVSSPAIDEVRRALSGERRAFPVGATIACQGIDGAYSGIAAKRLFEITDITYFKNFDGVFQAVEQGLCDYGVLPIENSTAGSVLSVYDLMKKHNFYIVKSIRLKVSHCLLVKDPAKKIKKVISHEQALSQCADFIKKLGATPVMVENTAIAAQLVAESEEEGLAAIASEQSAELYHLEVAEKDIQDCGVNFTRFICISKRPELFKGADKISIMTSLEHKAGSLNNLLSRFYTEGLNLTKLESRPIAGGDFEFMFYFDFVGDIESPGVLNLLADLELTSPHFVFLGGYKESI